MDQLYIQNWPFDLAPWQIQEILSEAFPTPEKVVCLKRGPYQELRRQSCFAHWKKGSCPDPSAISGWLPMRLRAAGWTVALQADHVKPLVLWQHFWL